MSAHIVESFTDKLQAAHPGAQLRQNRAVPTEKQWEVRLGETVIAAAYSQREAAAKAIEVAAIKRGFR